MSKSNTGLPKSWESVPIGELAEVRLGRQRSPEKASGPHQVPYLRAGNVVWSGLDLSDVKEMDFSPSEQEVYRLRAGDIVLSEASGSASEVGKPALWREEIPLCCFQNTLIRVRPPPGMSHFLMLQFLQLALLGKFVDSSKGVGIHHLGAERFSAIPVSVAPLREQGRIVAAIEQHLSDIDAGVAAVERALAKLKRYRAAVLKAACEGKLVPTEAELARKAKRDYEPADVLLERILEERRSRWEADQLAKMKAKGQEPKDDKWKAKYELPALPPDTSARHVPDGWARASMGQLASLITSGSRGWGDRYSESGPLFVRAQDIKTDRLNLDTVARVDLSGAVEGTRTRLKQWDLLITITGANVTKSAAVTIEIEEAYVSQHVGLVRPVLPAIAPWLFHWVVSPAQGRAHLEKLAYGAGKPGLNLQNLNDLPALLPPLAEQHRIVAEVDRLLSNADETEQTLRAQLARASRLRQAVLKRAFEGKLVPQDPTDEPATALLARLRAEKASAPKPTSRPRKR